MESLSNTLYVFTKKAFDIRDGEMRRAILMMIHIFLIITTLLIVKPTVNALFLSTFGVRSLPYAFIWVAITAAVVTTLYARALHRVSFYQMLSGTLWFCVVSLGLFGALLSLGIGVRLVLYLFYVWVALFALLTTSQFWVLANLVFNPREAKRLYGFIGAGAIAGGIFGGYLTSFLAPFLRSENLAFVGAILLSGTIPISRYVWKHYAAEKYIHTEIKEEEVPNKHPARMVLESRHLTYIALIVGFSVLVAKLVDYQFGGIASTNIQDADELTAFFGFWFSTFNVLSLLLQLFITRRVVGTLGVGISLVFLPSLILFATIMLFFNPISLMAAVLLKMSDGSFKQSINKAALELLILPIPLYIKKQTKTFIDVFVDSMATGLGGLLLIFLVDGLRLSTLAVNALIVLFVLIWLYLAYQVRIEYIRLFKLQVEGPGNAKSEAASPVLDLKNESVLGGIRKVLQEGGDQQRLYLLNKLLELKDNRLYEAYIPLIHHPDFNIRAAAIENLASLDHRPFLPEIEAFIHDESLRVRIRAFQYLGSQGPDSRSKWLDRFLHHPDYRVRGAAWVFLAQESQLEPALSREYQLEDNIRQLIHEATWNLPEEQRDYLMNTAIKAIGYGHLEPLYPVIEEKLAQGDPDLLASLIQTVGLSQQSKFIPYILPLMVQRKWRENVLQSLDAFGNNLVPVARQEMDHETTPLLTKRLLPRVVKRIPTQGAVRLLMQWMEHTDPVIRYEALRGLNKLRVQTNDLTFDRKAISQRILVVAHRFQTILGMLYVQQRLEAGLGQVNEVRQRLIDLLEKRLDRQLEIIFRLLGLTYPPADMLAIYKGLSSPATERRISSLEFLDNLLEPGIKRVLIPLIESSMLETITEETIRDLDVPLPSERDTLIRLLDMDDPRIRMAVLRLIQALGDTRYREVLEKVVIKGMDKEYELAAGILKEWD
ncbi:MAG: HEAT repeat domain-containing protein [Saprospiraceae bacterium]|nr:HEAT repeat domain-containing protein [Saprospiraceae bacterium]